MVSPSGVAGLTVDFLQTICAASIFSTVFSLLSIGFLVRATELE